MQDQTLQRIAVIGAGTMGNGICHVFAQYGYDVHMIDVRQEAIEKALATIASNMDRQLKKGIINEEDKVLALSRIKTFTSIEPAAIESVDLVIEAAVEQLEIKQKIFEQIDTYAPPHAILASNTSSISITRLAACTKRADRVVGMHFMNPVPVMKLVEVIKGYNTDIQVVKSVVSLASSLEKLPVVVNDYPGFVSNRILMPMINEAIETLFQGVADVESIDQVMKLGMAHPMGPLQLADFIGLDVCLYILRVLHEGFGKDKYAPCPLLVNMVEAGELGAKTGRGFYDWTNPKALKPSPRFHGR